MLGRVAYLVVLFSCRLVSAHLVLRARLLEAELTKILLVEHEALLRRVDVAGDLILHANFFTRLSSRIFVGIFSFFEIMAEQDLLFLKLLELCEVELVLGAQEAQLVFLFLL